MCTVISMKDVLLKIKRNYSFYLYVNDVTFMGYFSCIVFSYKLSITNVELHICCIDRM